MMNDKENQESLMAPMARKGMNEMDETQKNELESIFLNLRIKQLEYTKAFTEYNHTDHYSDVLKHLELKHQVQKLYDEKAELARQFLMVKTAIECGQYYTKA